MKVGRRAGAATATTATATMTATTATTATTVLALAVWAAACCLPGNAMAADAQLWTRLDTRLPLDSGRTSGNTSDDNADDIRSSIWSLRLQTILRFSWDEPGLSLLSLRGGPQWRPAEWFHLAANGYVGATRRSGELVSDYRVELEPIVRFQLKPIRVSNRIRIEERWSDGGRRPMRFRDQLTLSWRWTERFEPLVYGEAFLTSGAGFTQFRVSGGVRISLQERGQLEVGYLNQRRSEDGWASVHVLNLAWEP